MTTTADLTASVNYRALTEEAVALLRDYVRIDTTNPPGDVARAAGWVEAFLRAEGIEPRRLGPSPEKANVVATLDGEGGAERAFVLAHHMDVVPASADGWTVDPFGGELRDGYIYGRGTLDMKGFGVLTLLCAATARRLGVPLHRSLRLLATADEEVGGVDGAKWLAEHHLDEIGGEYLLTEGTFGRRTRRVTYYPIQVAEKGVSTVKLTARGRPGHASSPTEDNAVVRMARAIARLGEYRSPPIAQDLARRYLRGFPPAALGLEPGRSVDELDEAEMERVIQSLGERRGLTQMLRNTLTPTMVYAGAGQNVIPAVCEAHVDCRTLPGVGPEDLLRELATVIDDPAIEMTLVKSSIGTESPPDTPLFEILRSAVLAEEPGVTVVPSLTSAVRTASTCARRGSSSTA